ncbi:MAG: DNA polymerase III subunit delta' [Xanthomonadales bacterium]|nr:DNA polymerase III subunit delta' [Xanthomonadales bacterium]MCC6594150.1 DNA polymerase III subunit delta' [Xanthomonadales bacterium]
MPPTTFPWHATAWQRVSASLARDQLAHALLIHAEGGMHKLAFGRTLAHGLLCAAPLGGLPCGECRQCALLAVGNHPDYIEVQPVDSVQIRIDQIRELSERLAMRPQLAQRQAALLWPAEAMNAAAANALLKTLEEPAGDTHLLLLAERIGRLPATIRSRCQRLPLARAQGTQATAEVARLAAVDGPRAQAALAYAGGDPELALAVLAAEPWKSLLGLVQRLVDLARGQVDAPAFVAAFRGEGPQLLQRWSRLIALAVRAQAVPGGAFEDFLGLTSRLEMSTLLPLATQLERARALAGSGVREDLLIHDLAARWSAAFRTGQRGRVA